MLFLIPLWNSASFNDLYDSDKFVYLPTIVTSTSFFKLANLFINDFHGF